MPKAKKDFISYDDLRSNVIELYRNGYSKADIASRYSMAETTVPCDKGLIEKIVFDCVKSGEFFEYSETMTFDEIGKGTNELTGQNKKRQG